jgi:hypothetical protein
MVIGVQIIAEFALLLSKIPIDEHKVSNRGYLWPSSTHYPHRAAQACTQLFSFPIVTALLYRIRSILPYQKLVT